MLEWFCKVLSSVIKTFRNLNKAKEKGNKTNTKQYYSQHS